MRNLCQNLLLSYTQFKRLWTYIKTRTVKDRTYYRYLHCYGHLCSGRRAPQNTDFH